MNTELTTYLRSKQVITNLVGKGLPEAEGRNYIASALRLIASDPKLANCSKQSILNSLALCAELKLSPEKSFDYLYFIPYGNSCTPMIGARGMKALLLREPAVTKLSIHVIKEGDAFNYTEDSDGGIHYKFKPQLFAEEDAKILGVVAYLEVSNGTGIRQHLTRMSKAEIDKIKSMSKSTSIWEKHYEEMAKKTVMRRLYKEVPTIVHDNSIDKAISLDDNNHTSLKEVTLAANGEEDIDCDAIVSSNTSVQKDAAVTLAEDLKSIDI